MDGVSQAFCLTIKLTSWRRDYDNGFSHPSSTTKWDFCHVLWSMWKRSNRELVNCALHPTCHERQIKNAGPEIPCTGFCGQENNLISGDGNDLKRYIIKTHKQKINNAWISRNTEMFLDEVDSGTKVSHSFPKFSDAIIYVFIYFEWAMSERSLMVLLFLCSSFIRRKRVAKRLTLIPVW